MKFRIPKEFNKHSMEELIDFLSLDYKIKRYAKHEPDSDGTYILEVEYDMPKLSVDWAIRTYINEIFDVSYEVFLSTKPTANKTKGFKL